MEARFELGFEERFWFDWAAVGFDDLEGIFIKGGGVAVQANDDGLYKSVACVTRLPKVVVSQIAPMFEIPEHVMLEMIGIIGEGRAAAIQDTAIDAVEQAGIRLGTMGVNALIWTHVITPVHGSGRATVCARSMPVACEVF